MPTWIEVTQSSDTGDEKTMIDLASIVVVTTYSAHSPRAYIYVAHGPNILAKESYDDIKAALTRAQGVRTQLDSGAISKTLDELDRQHI